MLFGLVCVIIGWFFVVFYSYAMPMVPPPTVSCPVDKPLHEIDVYPKLGGDFWTRTRAMFPLEWFKPDVLEYRILWWEIEVHEHWSDAFVVGNGQEPWDIRFPATHPSRYFDDHTYALYRCRSITTTTPTWTITGPAAPLHPEFINLHPLKIPAK